MLFVLCLSVVTDSPCKKIYRLLKCFNINIKAGMIWHIRFSNKTLCFENGNQTIKIVYAMRHDGDMACNMNKRKELRLLAVALPLSRSSSFRITNANTNETLSHPWNSLLTIMHFSSTQFNVHTNDT